MRMSRVRRKSKMRSMNRRNKLNRKTKKRTQRKTNKRIKKITRKLMGGMDPVQGKGSAAAPGAADPGEPSDPGEMGEKGLPVAASTQVKRLPGIRDKQAPKNLATEAEKKALASLPLSSIIGEDGDKIIDNPLSYADEMNKLKSDITRKAGIIKQLESEKKILESELLVQTQLAQGLVARFPELISENKMLKSENQRLRDLGAWDKGNKL